MRRLRLRLPRLPKTWQISTAVPFGEEDIFVDAAIQAEKPVPADHLWVNLRGWHILEQPEPRLLVFEDGAGSSATLALARVMAQQMNASATLLAIAADSDEVESRRAFLLARQREAGLHNSELRVRIGDAAQQILQQQNEALYSVVMLGSRSRRSLGGLGPSGRRRRPSGRLGASTTKVLELSPNPVMVVKNSRPHMKRILICTAVGEPGKNDVRFGGSLARRLGASVTLLYIARDEEEPGQLAHAHLERGSATLRALDIPVEVAMRKAASPGKGILAASTAGDYDLIVIGNHGPRSTSMFARDDVMLQVLARADRPVLVVPSERV